MKQEQSGTRLGTIADGWTILGLLLGLMFFLVSGWVTSQNIQALKASDQAVRHTHTVLINLSELLSTVQDAETGQRGYILTGSESYLEPYTHSRTFLPERLKEVGELTRDNPAQRSNLAVLKRHIDAKLDELGESINLRRQKGFDAAREVIASDRGKLAMDAIRAQLNAMAQEEVRLREMRLAEMADASRSAITAAIVTSLLGAVLTIAIFVLLRRNARARAREEWLQAGQLGLAAAMRGDLSVEQISEAILTFLAQYIGFQGGAIFKGEAGQFYRAATIGVPDDTEMTQSFSAKEGLLGRVVTEGDVLVLDDVPENYLRIGSSFGWDRPRQLVIVPAKADDTVNAVMELGFFKPVSASALALLEEAGSAIGIALRSARFRTRLQDSLEEMERQAGVLQTQSEELRVSNEELEEQGRALKESQVRLEHQQVELEQTNSQLEEQAQTLEHQRQELERAAVGLQRKADELEQASRYKSDFLANMSHELRTPLNSLLILSKLLGDDPQGTLTDEQVKFARTIESSGNDLLTLINDILDLSKIEAGHIEIHPEPVRLQRLVDDIRQLFQPVANERNLAFAVEVVGDRQGIIETDRLRLEQILKNLLSNAFKFTEKGSVTLTISSAPGNRMTFAVKDTGIGIPPEKQQNIFEAFHQADGTISRKYGGTGLGLSISRELAKLLGGQISMESKAGEGSTFSVSIPIAYQAGNGAPQSRSESRNTAAVAPVASTVASLQNSALPSVAPTWIIEDDRASLSGERRVLLVIEDDEAFATITRDLSRELGFQCIVANTAEEALALARDFKPNAIVLDIGLPDQSGLTVLDRLKHDDETRHIPIHVISGSDYGPTAMALGAVGYLLKPVKHEELSQVLTGLQEKLSTRLRRVLVVEDDPVQRDAVSKLLGSSEVETVGVGTAAECLEELRRQTYDCMVLDLSLPDTSGFTLLETLSEGGAHGFPPVIVYTGHDLSADDEQRLRRFSNSIIIKGAKSPERLLDEVSLFLHQVVSELPPEQRKMIQQARHRDAALEGRRILVVEDDVRNIYSLTSVLEPRGAIVQIARNGQEAIDALAATVDDPKKAIDLVLMDVMMPVMDGLSATRQIRSDPRWAKLAIVMLTAKAMPDDQQRCIEAGANDYMAKPIDVDKLLSLIRVWMPR